MGRTAIVSEDNNALKETTTFVKSAKVKCEIRLKSGSASWSSHIVSSAPSPFGFRAHVDQILAWQQKSEGRERRWFSAEVKSEGKVAAASAYTAQLRVVHHSGVPIQTDVEVLPALALTG